MRSPPAARRGRRVLSRPDARPSAAQKVERLAAGLHLLGAPSGGSRHTLFVDDAAAAASFDAAAHFETAPELLPRRFNRPRLAQLASEDLVAGKGAAGAASRPGRKGAAAAGGGRALGKPSAGGARVWEKALTLWKKKGPVLTLATLVVLFIILLLWLSS